MEKLLNIAEVADVLKITSDTLRRKIREGEIACIRFNSRSIRIRKSALDAYLRSKEDKTTPTQESLARGGPAWTIE